MRARNRIFLLSLLGTVFLAAGIIFLPRYFSRRLDEASMNQVQLLTSEHFSFLEPGNGSISETAAIFQKTGTDNISLISSTTEPGKINTEMTEAVYEQAMIASELGLLPWIGSLGYQFAYEYGLDELPLDYWGDQIRYARYYSLIYSSEEDSGIKRLLNFWALRYSDGKSFDYYFLVDAQSYQIYYMEIYNEYTETIYRYYAALYGKTLQLDQNEEYAFAKDVGSIYDWNNFTFWTVDLFGNGCEVYYNADDLKSVNQNGDDGGLALVSLTYYNDATVYIEESLISDPGINEYHGISVGFNKLKDKIHRMLH